ncbi:PAS domain S-box protein [Phenylobacterium sp.]|uniref:PAS domain S-box protein n=1 Tax=Phenylobacterium sp. TaxID=1871053 RepID=UPI00122C033A|nr:PAS domain S-box protein [Phenylobacterium sp.]THD71161.1 MAG: PAS domain S-box protein [Phenylobacterium sp.]
MSEAAGRQDPEDPARARLTEAVDTSRRDVTWDVLSEKINDLIIITDLNGAIFYASPAARNMGYEPHELIGLTGADLVHPDDLLRFLANRDHAYSGDDVIRQDDREHRFRRRDGKWIWMEGNPSILPGPDSRPAGVLNVFRDVTDRRAARDALREQARRASLLEEVAGVGYWRLDAGTLEASWSAQIFRMHGLPVGDTVALARAMDLIHPDDKAESDARIAEALRTGEGWKDILTRIVQPDGGVCYLSGRGVCETGATGEVIAVFGTVLDVTEQIVAKQALEESERRYRLLAENITDMISQTSVSTGRLTYLSPSVERLTGFTAADLVGARMQDLVHVDDRARFMQSFRDLLSGRREPGQAIRFRARNKAGSWLWLESNPRLVHNEDGVAVDIIDMTRDVGPQQALKDRLREALAEAEQAVQVKSEFLANMSHEIRTPLTAVLGYTSLLAERDDLDAVAKGQVERIAAAGRGLLAIVNDVLDFSKLEAGQLTVTPQPTAAGVLAREVLEMFVFQAQAKSLALRFDSAPDVPDFVALDGRHLRQALVNLVGNAVKFTDRGAVSVSLAYDPAAGRLAVEVTDTGPGIAAKAQEKLFQRFSQVDASSTRAKGGSGLGLAICKGLATAMGGSISLHSRVGKGSTFRLELPAPVVARPVLDDAADVRGDLEGLRVLVADDNPANRELVRAMLEPHGVEVSEVCDGQEALEFAAGLPVDLILMDLRMPRLDGRAAALAIRTGDGPNRDVPILSFSAEHDSSSGRPEPGSLFTGRVRKPMQAAELIGALCQALVDEAAPIEMEPRYAVL